VRRLPATAESPDVIAGSPRKHAADGYDVVRLYRGDIAMKYVIEREIPNAGNLTDEELREVSIRSLEVLAKLGPTIQWLHSFVTDNKVYCVYIAPDEAAIQRHAEQVGLPANRISAVRRLLDPANAM
jgi:hypothetical protein